MRRYVQQARLGLPVSVDPGRVLQQSSAARGRCPRLASALRTTDPQPASVVELGLPPRSKDAADNKVNTTAAAKRVDASFDELLLTGGQDKQPQDKQEQGQPKFLQRLGVPPELEGAKVAPIAMPDAKNKLEYDAAVKKYFPAMPDIGPDPEPVLALGGKALTLSDLQQLAHANSPLLRQAASDVAAARGAMIQAGLYSNPTFGLQGQTGGPSGGPTFGPLLSQNISTMGKLRLAQCAAEKDLENAQLAYRRAETDLEANVRTGYFSVLVGLENIRQNRALVSLTDEMYKVMVQQLGGGELATYEPMQIGVFAAQARAGLITARNSYTLAWKQLGVDTGSAGHAADGGCRHHPRVAVAQVSL